MRSLPRTPRCQTRSEPSARSKTLIGNEDREQVVVGGED